ncbi:MAG: trypsin-like peptidase domain-containing protein [Armatimonadetes bacterium]|nr:trypsin-like peptidase domain-containing protein [Armatimonadota bacterium]
MKHLSESRTRAHRVVGLAAAIVGTVVAAMSLGCGKPSETLVYEPIQRTASYVEPSGNLPDLKTLDSMFADMAEDASEAVVHIAVPPGRRNGRIARPGGGEGSGFILTSDGWIVTNDHVVAAVDEVTVILADGRELVGKVTRTDDQQLDIALVKIDAVNLRTLTLADSNKVRPGQFAFAAGSPFGLENSVTFGHVSAIGRPGVAGDGFTQARRYSGMIQTDASINPGNSGGPLINIEGEVIGVNTSIFSSTGTSTGIGFAIPSNVVRAVADELIRTGKFDRGLIGVFPRDLKPYEISERGFAGAYLLRVDPGNPAHDAGMRVGDVITKIGSAIVTNEIDLRVAMYRHSPKDKVQVTYRRDGDINTASVTLAAPTDLQAVQPPSRTPNPFRDRGPELRQPRRPRLGLELFDVDDTARDQYGLPDGLEGAVVTVVVGGSLAEQAGLKEGDVIRQVDGEDVHGATGVSDFMSRANWGDEVVIAYMRITDGQQEERQVRIRLRFRP